MPILRFLTNYLPAAGMVYSDNRRITQRDLHDTYVLESLRKAALVPKDDVSGLVAKEAKLAVDQALAGSIALGAREDVVTLLKDSADNYEDWGLFKSFDEIKGRTPWFKDLSSTIFLNFFYQLIEARAAWHRNPRPPFDVNQHSLTAKAIDAFFQAAGDDWATARANYEIFEFVGGLDEEGDGQGEEEKNQGNDAGGARDGDLVMRDLEEALEEDMAIDEVTKGIDKMDLD